MEKKSQCEKLYDLLSDGNPHRTDEIMRSVYGGDHLGLARVGGRIFDIKKKYHIEIEGRKDKENKTLYWYQLLDKPIAISIAKEEKPKGQKALFPLGEIDNGFTNNFID